VRIPEVNESLLPNENPYAYVARVSALKAEAVWNDFPTSWIVAADTTVVIEGSILGKPGSEEEAKTMLSLLQGRTHMVLTGYSVFYRPTELCDTEVETSLVTMMPLSLAAIEQYIASGESLDKAGAYAMQGLGGHLIERIEGSYSNIVGLPTSSLIRKLRAHGVLADL